jgi:hypothetical protein
MDTQVECIKLENMFKEKRPGVAILVPEKIDVK